MHYFSCWEYLYGFGLLCVFCIFHGSLPVKLQMSPCYSLFAVETKAVHVPGSVEELQNGSVAIIGAGFTSHISHPEHHLDVLFSPCMTAVKTCRVNFLSSYTRRVVMCALVEVLRHLKMQPESVQRAV